MSSAISFATDGSFLNPTGALKMENPDRSYNLSLFLRIWATGFGFLGAPTAMLTGLSIYLLMAALVTLLVAIPMYFLISYLGDGLGNLLFRTSGGPADPEAALKGISKKPGTRCAATRQVRQNRISCLFWQPFQVMPKPCMSRPRLTSRPGIASQPNGHCGQS